jgi:long-chain acyl-CoA synthetase
MPRETEIKGPQLISGYWGNKEETNLAVQDGWFKSGDICLFDKQGFLRAWPLLLMMKKWGRG